ncbi:MAG: hypothetical protein ABI693_20965 [Bryobacteraceae bacterium]
MRSRLILVLAITFASAAFGDTLTLKDGRTFQGTFLGGDSRQVRLFVGDGSRSFSLNEVDSIRFGSDSPSTSLAPAPPPPVERSLRPSSAAPTPAPSPTPYGVEVPSGTSIVVRMIDSVDSQKDSIGQTYRASLDEDVMAGGNTVIPRGADVLMKLVDDKESGKLSGRTELTLDLLTITVNGTPINIDTQTVTQSSSSRTGRTAKVVGGTAALGAIIGAIAGGGRGAAIGAASGAGAGGAVQVLTKGQTVRIPSETRLTFTLQQSLRI